MITPDRNTILAIYKKMLLIRRFEETLESLFSSGRMHGTCHLCIGEEATAAATAAALKPQDLCTGTHRGHGHALSFGLDEKKLMAEFFGRSSGICGGMGGSMHIFDFEKGFLGTNGIVAGSIPIATGAALSIKRKGIKDRVAACFFGDGATNEGVFYESLNMSKLWKLPILYVCENNQYAMSTHISKSMADPDLTKKAAAFGIKTFTVDGNDALAVYGAVAEAREFALKSGPVFLLENTYRIAGHSKSDTNAYRTHEEVKRWKARCPIKRLEAYILEHGLSAPGELAVFRQEAGDAVKAAVDFAEASPAPEISKVESLVFYGETGADA